MSSDEVVTDIGAGVYNNRQWLENWALGETDFHHNTHDTLLDSHTEELFGGKLRSIFAPLCGKSPDLIWMYERGHTVCGVELAEQAVIELFQENNLTAEVEEIKDKGKLYKTKDKRLVVYCVDLFSSDIATYGQFDVIWDSRAFVAINVADQQRYVTLLLSLMKEECRYFLSTDEFDPTLWPGPPHNMTDKMVTGIFGSRCKIKIIKEEVLVLKSQIPNKGVKKFGHIVGSLPSLVNRWHMLTLK